MFDTWKLKKRLDSMENTLQRLQEALQGIELEWINAYAKFKKIAGRIAKDQSVIDSRQSVQEGPGQDTPQSENHGPGLSVHQKQVQQQILRRRGGMTQ